MRRFSINTLLGLVALMALALAALVNATDPWLGAVFLLMLGVLFAGITGAILRWPDGAWVGLTVSGWGFLIIGNIPGWFAPGRILSDAASDWVFLASNPLPPDPPRPTNFSPIFAPSLKSPHATDEMKVYFKASAVFAEHQVRREKAKRIGHYLAVLLYALAGAILGGVLARERRPGVATTRAPDSAGSSDPTPLGT